MPMYRVIVSHPRPLSRLDIKKLGDSYEQVTPQTGRVRVHAANPDIAEFYAKSLITKELGSDMLKSADLELATRTWAGEKVGP